MAGLTFDTGALIALVGRRKNMLKVFDTAATRGWPMTVPMPVVSEWWRGPNPRYDDLLRGLVVEPLALVVAKLAGEAIAAVPSATTIDAIVMATAALHGGVVYTSDPDDLGRLRDGFFKGVKVFRV